MSSACFDKKEDDVKKDEAVCTTTEESDESITSSSSSSSSGSSTKCGAYIPYSQRPEWADVTPLPQDDGPDPVVRISYSEEFREVYDYVRAMIAMNEMSLRAFHLTTHALRLNPANYTVWEFRRRLLHGLDMDLRAELEYLNSVIQKTPKNYQVWHHRRALVEWRKDYTGELEFVENVFSISEDWKNFHGWQHRSWVISHFHLETDEAIRKKELSFTKRLLDADLRNNSVWNYRMFLLRKSFPADNAKNDLKASVKEGEISMTLTFIRQVPDNESAWNYLLGLLNGASINRYPTVLQLCDDLHAAGRLHQFSLDCQLSAMEDKLKCEDLSFESRKDIRERALSFYDLLIDKIDPIRSRYWQYRKDMLSEL